VANRICSQFLGRRAGLRRELHRPAGSVVLSVDEKTAIAARSRKYPTGWLTRPADPELFTDVRPQIQLGQDPLAPSRASGGGGHNSSRS
jgi:hypothetical protein